MSIMSIVKRYPILKTMTSYCVINILADMYEQVIMKKRTKETYIYAKTVRITVVGTFLIGPIAFTWIRLAEKILPGRSVQTVLKKLLIDQTCVGPFSISTFYISTTILEGKTDIFEEWRQKFLKTWTTGMMFWPVAQAVNFSVIPHEYRTSRFMPLCSFLWTIYLCYMKEQQMKKIPAQDSTDQSDSASVQSLVPVTIDIPTMHSVLLAHLSFAQDEI